MLVNRYTEVGSILADPGKSIRLRGKETGLAMRHTTDTAGLSVGFISQVERVLTPLSLSSLPLLAGALEKPISSFLNQPSQRRNVFELDSELTIKIEGRKEVANTHLTGEKS